MRKHTTNVKDLVNESIDISDVSEEEQRQEAIRRLKQSFGNVPKLLSVDLDELETEEIEAHTAKIDAVVRFIESGNQLPRTDVDPELQRKLNEAEAEVQKQKDRANTLDRENKTLQQQVNELQAGKGHVLTFRTAEDLARGKKLIAALRDENGNLPEDVDSIKNALLQEGVIVETRNGKVKYPSKPPNGDDTDTGAPKAPTSTPPAPADDKKKSRRARVWDAIAH